MDYYTILGLKKDPKITLEDITRCYRKKALKLHPDKGGNDEDFKMLTKAYETLKDPIKKTMYDSNLINELSPIIPTVLIVNITVNLKDIFVHKSKQFVINKWMVNRYETTNMIINFTPYFSYKYNFKEKGHQYTYGFGDLEINLSILPEQGYTLDYLGNITYIHRINYREALKGNGVYNHKFIDNKIYTVNWFDLLNNENIFYFYNYGIKFHQSISNIMIKIVIDYPSIHELEIINNAISNIYITDEDKNIANTLKTSINPSKMKVVDLKKYCRDNGIKNYSCLKKKELILLVEKFLK